MARAYTNVLAQWGPESTPGTAVPGAVGFTSATVTLNPTIERETVTPQGSRYASLAYTTKDYTEGSLEGVPSYTEAASLFRWIYGEPLTTELSEGSNIYTHDFTLDAGTTRTIEFGDDSHAARATGVFVSGYSLEFGRNSGDSKISADLVGGLWEDNCTLTPGATLPEASPVEPGQVCVYVDDTLGTIGTTKANPLAIKIDLSDLRAADWRLDCAAPSLVGSVETAPKAEIELTVEADAAGRALLAALRSGATKYLRVRATGPSLGAGGGWHTITLDFAVQPLDHAREDSDGIYVAKVNLTVVRDASGFAHSVSVVDASPTVV